MRGHALLTVLGVSLVFVACGSGGSDGSGSPFGGDGGIAIEGGTTPDGGRAPGDPCPTSEAAAGTPCTKNGQTCEVGGKGPGRLCSAQASCSNGTWIVSAPATACVGAPSDNPSACPAGFSTLAKGAACPVGLTGRCVYDEGICDCEPCSSDGGTVQAWTCASYPKAAASCPDTRPAIGSACASEGQSCTYGAQCGPMKGIVHIVSCNGGSWTQTLEHDVFCPLESCPL